MILLEYASPMPGNAFSSSAVAELMSTSLLEAAGAAFYEEAAGAGFDAGLLCCAITGRMLKSATVTKATIIDVLRAIFITFSF